ncbi:MAG: DUF87 domain-containing protein, partial [Nanoarchaeota archaeon]|nr:DUF87 domain-containing protein [Nanoarchaeota archaeon]
MTYQRTLTAEDICKKLKPIFGDKIDKIYFNYVTSDSRETKEEIFSLLHALYQKHFEKLLDSATLLEPPKQHEVDGKYRIGNVLYSKKEIYPFSLRDSDFPRHICISGMSGSGKTTLAFNIIEGLITNNKPFLIFDWKKSFRPLLTKDPSLTCFTIGEKKLANNFKLNINRPPQGVSPKEWISVMCDLIAESFFVSYGVHKVLLETLDESYKEWGVYNGSENYPTWNHIKWRLEEKLNKSRSREQTWIESALRVATVLTFGDFGEVVNYKGKSTINIEDILKKRTIFELNSLGNIEKKFFCEFLLMYIYKSKKAEQNKVNNKFNYAILVDEAHNIFLKDKTKFVSESVTDMVYREMREYGISLICLDQHISKLSDTVKGNSACHIAFQQQLPEDIETISRLMNIHEKKEIFSSLEVGEGIVRLSERYTKPFFIKAPNTDLRKINITEEQIKDRVKQFFNTQELEKNTDIEFNTKLITGGAFDINNLFKNINLPRSLNLHAIKNQEECSPNELPQIISAEYTDSGKIQKENISVAQTDTVYATIKRRLKQGEDLSKIEKQMESIYDSKEVMIAVNKVIEEELNKKEDFEIKSEPEEEFNIKFPEPKSIFPIKDEEEKEII